MTARGFALLTVLLLAVNVADPVTSTVVSLDLTDTGAVVSIRHGRHAQRSLAIVADRGSVRSATGVVSRVAASDLPGARVRVAWLVDLRRAHSLSFEPAPAGEEH